MNDCFALPTAALPQSRRNPETDMPFICRFFRDALLAVLVYLGTFKGVVAAQERTDFPADARERYEKGVDLRKKGQLDEAIRAFDDAIELGMQAFPRVHLSRAG